MNKLIQGASASLEICIEKNWTPNIVFSLDMVSISYLIFDINNKYQGNDMHGNEIGFLKWNYNEISTINHWWNVRFGHAKSPPRTILSNNVHVFTRI